MSEMEAFVAKVSKGLPAGKRERFVSSNWSLVIMVIGEAEGRLAGAMRERAEVGRDGAGG